ncbi:MAG: hypothetical protein AB7F98_00110 [Novosphingobium sp.]
MIGALAAAIAMASAAPAMAGDNAPATQKADQDMGAMKQQMMQQIRQCMDQMPPMSGNDQTAMRQQMMERMHGCMEQMMSSHHCGAMMGSSGPDQGTEHKPDQHDHSGQ